MWILESSVTVMVITLQVLKYCVVNKNYSLNVYAREVCIGDV